MMRMFRLLVGLIILLDIEILGFVIQRIRGQKVTREALPVEDVMQCLRREYISFFDPLEADKYLSDVTFNDPLTSLSGLDAYRANVDMLAGRNFFGKLLFDDAAIALHDVRKTDKNKIRTRWTLRFTFIALPWRPIARFTGVSDYEIDPSSGKLAKQIDYWDSIDLKPNGEYQRSSKVQGLNDLVDQLFNPAQPTDQELPYELLRRGADYSVRRYPATLGAQVIYENRPEGYDLLGSFCSGYNQQNKKISPFVPSIITVPRTTSSSEKKRLQDKVMRWPLTIVSSSSNQNHAGGNKNNIPEPSTNAISIDAQPEFVVAVLRFTSAATADSVAYYTKQLEVILARDGLRPLSNDLFTVAQFDAIFSVGDRRNEIWIPIEVPDYWQI